VTAADLHHLRSAFVSTQTVTAEQWDAAAAKGGDVLDHLSATPAWWVPHGSAPAVTAFHRRAVKSLADAHKLDALARRLRWGDYLIRSELGRGGMGVVFRAWDLKANEEVALKRVRVNGRQVRTRFQREATILARLDHPAVAKFRGVEKLDGADVLVMEYVPGESAARLVRRLAKEGKRVPWTTAVGWTLDILDALSHAHGRQVVHRDIKPGNVMITGIAGTAVKLLDMGLAKCSDMPADGQLTIQGQILGTSEYMPPEQWAGGAVTPAADLYALGGTLFFLLAARTPFTAGSPHQHMLQHLKAEVPSVRAHRPEVPEQLDAVIARMMAKNPLHRGTARELRWQLAGVLASAAHATADTPPPPADVVIPLSHASMGSGGTTVVAAAGSTVATTRVWPLVCEMGLELKRLFGLAPRRRKSVFDEPPLARLGGLALAVAGCVLRKK
jgi:serine/threonine protein kinase